tara:strand:+ start:855 stop:986 length:132 start_codon:yes stop_codon:yes gene_type:complete
MYYWEYSHTFIRVNLLDCNMENSKYPASNKEHEMYEELMEELE